MKRKSIHGRNIRNKIYRKKSFLYRISSAFLLMLLCYVGIVGWMYVNQRSLMYFPDKNIKDIKEYALPGTEDFMTESEDGTQIQIWFHKPVNPDMPVVLFYSGNSYNLSQKETKFKELLNLGYGFIAPSYHGFGRSGGTPSKEAILGDARTAIKVLNAKGYQTKDTILMGESLGSGVALEMAMYHKFKGILLYTPYTSISDRAREIYGYIPVKYLLKDDFINDDKIGRINTPILIVHGTNDDIIPHSHSEALYRLAQEPKKIVIYDGKNHNNLDAVDVFAQMTEFFLKPHYSENSKNNETDKNSRNSGNSENVDTESDSR
jgi:uncharacterized protein